MVFPHPSSQQIAKQTKITKQTKIQQFLGYQRIGVTEQTTAPKTGRRDRQIQRIINSAKLRSRKCHNHHYQHRKA